MTTLTGKTLFGLADGPTEIHKVRLAREIPKDVTPSTTMFPSNMRQQLADEAHALYDDLP